MKTLLFLGLLAGLAYLVIVNVGPISARVKDANTCDRLEELCSRGKSPDNDKDSCEEEMQTLRMNVGDEPVERAGACIANANSCVEATGCIAGASVGVLKGFLSGFERALGNGTAHAK